MAQSQWSETRKRAFKKVKRAAVFGLIRTLKRLLNAVPRGTAGLIGAWIALAAWKILPRERHRIQRHLTLVYGDQLTPVQKHNIGRDWFIQTGKNIADALRFQKHFSREIKPLVDVEGMEHFEEVCRRGKGLIGVTGHIGNFELIPAFVASLGYEVAVIARELYDPRLDQLLVENRRALGMANIATTDPPKVPIKWLSQGKVLGVLIDTDSTRVSSIHVPAFGRLSNTPVGQSRMALMTGAGLVPIACLRTEDNRYRLIIKPEVTAEPGLSKQDAIVDLTVKCTKALEEIIRQNLSQWIWLHNRWRTRPQNTA